MYIETLEIKYKNKLISSETLSSHNEEEMISIFFENDEFDEKTIDNLKDNFEDFEFQNDEKTEIYLGGMLAKEAEGTFGNINIEIVGKDI